MPSFEANKHMVSNGEYMEFVKDAGYARQELWSESGWRWKCSGTSSAHSFGCRRWATRWQNAEACTNLVRVNSIYISMLTSFMP